MISVVLPVFAEQETVAAIVARLAELLGEDLLEVLVVLSPRSPEATVRICQDLARREPRVVVLVQQMTPGVGYAFREGIGRAQGDLILLMDSDGEMDVEDVPRMLAALRSSGADLVVGSRWSPGGGAQGYAPFKYLLNRSYQLMFGLLYRTKVRDLTFGFKIGRAAVLKALPLRAQFQEIGCDVTLRVLRNGGRVEEVPTVWRKRKEGASSNPLARNLRYAKLALEIWAGR